jgi:O-antigen/teichoic acid export membrane protein
VKATGTSTEDVRNESPEAAPARVASSVAKNTAHNLLGMVAPAVAAVVAIPLLNRFLGTERIGFLTLAWALVGYFSFFDFGIGRALTKLVAERLGQQDEASLARLIWTALALMLGLGLFAALALATSASWLVRSVLNIEAGLQREGLSAIRLLALSVPLVVSSAGLRGVLEAQGKFFISNAIRAPLGVWLFAGPLVLIPFGMRHLGAVMIVLLAGRAAAWLAFLVACLDSQPALRHAVSFDSREIWPLVRFGGWMTVSNVISPLMAYMDRFLISNKMSLEAVAWYATPFEITTKVLLLASAVVTVLFPVFSALSAEGRGSVAGVYENATRAVGLALFVPTFALSLFATEGLTVWLGPQFAAHAAPAARVIALGCLLNGIATVHFAMVQAAGRPDWTALLHVLELPVYVALVLWLTSTFGILGTAIAWTLRMGIDNVALRCMARRQTGQLIISGGTKAYALELSLVLAFALSFIPMRFGAKATVFTLVLAATLAIVATLVRRGEFGSVTSRLFNIRRI